MCGIGDRGEIAARRAGALDLGDDLDAVGGSEEGERIACGGLNERRPLDGGEWPLGGASLGILHRAGREVGEHVQCSFGVYFAPPTP